MADNEWTVKTLMEALKRFPLEAKVYYEMGPNGPQTVGKAQYVKAIAFDVVHWRKIVHAQRGALDVLRRLS